MLKTQRAQDLMKLSFMFEKYSKTAKFVNVEKSMNKFTSKTLHILISFRKVAVQVAQNVPTTSIEIQHFLKKFVSFLVCAVIRKLYKRVES